MSHVEVRFCIIMSCAQICQTRNVFNVAHFTYTNETFLDSFSNSVRQEKSDKKQAIQIRILNTRHITRKPCSAII